MQYIDAFNGDADGLCALVQLRRNNPVSSTLITGIKRDINLLKRIKNGANTHITVLDISFETNVVDIERLLQSGAQITYIDHHQVGVIFDHPNLETDINLSADTCTSLIVDKQLQGKYRAWAITAAFGDNLADKAMALGLESGFKLDELALLKELGTYLNYNGYGASLDDLFFDPAILYQRLVKYDSPFEFIEQDSDIFTTLKTGYLHDMEKAEACSIISETDNTAVIELPNEKWARRVSGVLGNELANRSPDKAHAIITDKGDSTYLVSVRAPLTSKSGADTLVSQFPTGGGRKAAAGINALPKALLMTFIDEFERTYQVTKRG